MRTNIDIDDALMAEALRQSGFGTKKQVVEEGLKTLIRLNQQKEILKHRGKFKWEGDADEILLNRYTVSKG